MGRRLSVIIPCLNEEQAIDNVLKRMYDVIPEIKKNGIDDVEVIVVDDASTDRSWEVLQRWPQVIAIRNPRRMNYGGALKQGFAIAQGDMIGFLDMDGTYDPSEFMSMIQIMDEKDAGMVCGDRLSRQSEMPFVRQMGNRFFVALINFLYRQKISDSCTGQRIFKSRFKESFCLLSANDLNFSLSMTLHCLRHGVRLVETPVDYGRRIGSSKLLVFLDGPQFTAKILSAWVPFLITSLKRSVA